MKNETDKDTVQNEIETVLQNGVDFRITYCKPNIFQKLFLSKGRKFVIHPASLGTLLKISNELNKVKEFTINEASDADMFELSVDSVVKYKDNLVNAVAYAIINKGSEPSKRFLKFLNSNLQPKEALQLITLVLSQMGVRDFLASMVLASRTNLMTKTNSTRGKSSAES